MPVSRQMTGTFVCLQCEAGHADAACPLEEEPVHELGFCADNGERWRLMTTDREFASASVGQTVTVEGVAFPESGFLRASRVGYWLGLCAVRCARPTDAPEVALGIRLPDIQLIAFAVQSGQCLNGSRRARPRAIDLAGGTLDLWPLHVLHPGSGTINVAIDLRARCRVRPGASGFRVTVPDLGYRASRRRAARAARRSAGRARGGRARGLRHSRAPRYRAVFGRAVRLGTRRLVGADRGDGGRARRECRSPVRRPRPGGVRARRGNAGARKARRHAGLLSAALRRDPRPWSSAPAASRSERRDVDPGVWLRHLTLFDTRAAHSSGMNNWEIFRARLEGDHDVAARLEEVRAAAREMAEAVEKTRFSRDGRGARAGMGRAAAPGPGRVVPGDRGTRSRGARKAGAWAGKACGAGGGGCVVILSPGGEDSGGARGSEPVAGGPAPSRRTGEPGAHRPPPRRLGERLGYQRSFIQAMQRSSSRRIAPGDSARYRSPCPGRTHSNE